MIKVSPTQVSTFKLCPRKWGWQYIAGHKSPDSASKALGSRVHSILEEYLVKGTPPNTSETWRFKDGDPIKYPGKIALQMINVNLPKPGDAQVESNITFQKGGVNYNGFIDCHYLARTAIGKTAVIIDHKTSSDPKQWGKSDEDLKTDPQVLIYGLAALDLYKELDLIKCVWNYGSTKAVASAAYVAKFAAIPSIYEENFAEHVEPFAQLITKHKNEETDPLTLPFNADACGVYGGCPFKGLCKLSNKERIGAFIMGTSLVDELIAQASAENSSEQPDAGINPPESKDPEPESKAPDPEPESKTLEVRPPEVAPLPVAGKKAKGKAKAKAKTEPIAQAPAKPKTEPIAQAADAGAFDGLIDEMIDILAERAVKRLIERMRDTLTK